MVANNVAMDTSIISSQNKMEVSMLNFKRHYPDWQPEDLSVQVNDAVSIASS